MSEEPLRILYVGGWGRSGSTLLDRMLGQVPGVFSAGEVRMLWQTALAEHGPCGCGSPFVECEVWREVGAAAFGGWDSLDLDEVLALRSTLDRSWTTPLLLSRRSWPSRDTRIADYTAYLDRLFRAIRSVTGAGVIVDSSKSPSHALLVNRIRGADVRLVHLLRDPRGVAYSWQRGARRRRAAGEAVSRPRFGAMSSSVRWDLYNGMTPTLRHAGIRYLPVQYERLMANPTEGLRRILEFAGRPVGDGDLAFVEGDRVTLAPNHTAYGNRMRFTVGGLTLRTDEEWRSEMPVRDRRWVTGLTYPLLRRFGYG